MLQCISNTATCSLCGWLKAPIQGASRLAGCACLLFCRPRARWARLQRGRRDLSLRSRFDSPSVANGRQSLGRMNRAPLSDTYMYTFGSVGDKRCCGWISSELPRRERGVWIGWGVECSFGLFEIHRLESTNRLLEAYLIIDLIINQMMGTP